jgi:DNA-binding HxlR family transcriptional regulator
LKVKTKNGELLIPLRKLGFKEDLEFEIIKINDNVFVASGEKILKKELNQVDEKIFSLLRFKKLNERVEGKFEKFLNKKELERFKELLKEGVIEKFKLSSKYKKAVYRLKEKEKKREEKKIEKFDVKKQGSSIEEYSLEKNGFLIVKNEVRAKKLSEELKDRVKNGSIKGTKSFEGFYYIIETELYNKFADLFLREMSVKKTQNAEELSKKLNVCKELVKIVAEFLKEEGELIEKRRELYELV